MVTPANLPPSSSSKLGAPTQVPAVARLVVFANQRPVWNRWAEPQNPAGPTPPDGVFCRVEEFAARHFRCSGFEATFLESAPFHVLFSVYFWSVIQDRCDRRIRTVGILDRPARDQRQPSEVIWIRLPSDFGTPDYARRRAKAITSHLSAIGETRAELLELLDNWLAPSVGLRQYLWAHRHESIETARKLIEL